MKICYETVRNSEEIRTYITQADQSLLARGFTEHSLPTSPAAPSLPPASWPSSDMESTTRSWPASPALCTTSATWSTATTTPRPAPSWPSVFWTRWAWSPLTWPPSSPPSATTTIHRLPRQSGCRGVDPGRQDRCAPQPAAQQEHQSFDIHDRVNYAAERSELTLDRSGAPHPLLGINTNSAP